jgi:hypothetical protein
MNDSPGPLAHFEWWLYTSIVLWLMLVGGMVGYVIPLWPNVSRQAMLLLTMIAVACIVTALVAWRLSRQNKAD